MKPLTMRTGIATGLVALIAACGTEPLEDTKPATPQSTLDGGDVQQGTQSGGNTQPDTQNDIRAQYLAFCEVGQQILETAGTITEMNPPEIEVHDGDTITYHGTKDRSSAIDTAEVGNDQWPDQMGLGEFSNINYGQLGKALAVSYFRNAQRVWHVRGAGPDIPDTDSAGRRLGYHILDGKYLYECLAALGDPQTPELGSLAWETVTHYYESRTPPPLAQRVLDASISAGQPHFERPDLFKQHYR